MLPDTMTARTTKSCISFYLLVLALFCISCSDPQVPGPQVTPSSCPKSYAYYADLYKCVKIVKRPKVNYFKARNICLSEGGHLGTQKLQGSFKVFSNEIELLGAPYDTEAYWIGLNDDTNNGVYVWEDGTPLVRFDGSRWWDNWNTKYNDRVNDAAYNCVTESMEGWVNRSCYSSLHGFFCEINGCNKVGNGGCEQDCKLNLGAVKCSCRDGYKMRSKNTTHCTDIDECAEKPNICTHKCVNDNGSYHCQCRQGYELMADRKTCRDIDECKTGVHDCELTCENLQGSFRCSCYPGFRHGVNNKCEDIDECETENGQCDHKCLNTYGSRRCTCPFGFMTLQETRCISQKDVDVIQPTVLSPVLISEDTTTILLTMNFVIPIVAVTVAAGIFYAIHKHKIGQLQNNQDSNKSDPSKAVENNEEESQDDQQTESETESGID